MYTIIGADQKEYGPVTEEQILQWISEGRVNGKTLAKVAGGAWKPVATFPELAVHLPAAAAAQPTDSAGAPPLSSAGGLERESALRQVRGPAAGLIVTGVLGFICTLLLWVFQATILALLSQILPVDPQFDSVLKQIQNPAQTGYQIGSNILALIVCAIVTLGGVRMQSLRSRGLCMAASILALLPCVCPVCCIGIPIGIWGLVVLGKPEVSSQFR